MEIEILGINLAKRVFRLHGTDRGGKALHRSKVTRAALVGAVRELRPRVIAMEACSSAHHWARSFQEMRQGPGQADLPVHVGGTTFNELVIALFAATAIGAALA